MCLVLKLIHIVPLYKVLNIQIFQLKKMKVETVEYLQTIDFLRILPLHLEVLQLVLSIAISNLVLITQWIGHLRYLIIINICL